MLNGSIRKQRKVGSARAARQSEAVFLMGERLYLRPIRTNDVQGPYWQWLNDQTVTRYLESGVSPATKSGLKKYVERVSNDASYIMLAIIEKQRNAHIGNVKLGPIETTARRADVGILIGDRSCWGRGFAREALRLVVEHAFNRLNLNKITLGVHADHRQAIRVYHSLGFVIEGRLRRHLYRNGRYRDSFVMGLLHSDYKRARRGTDS
ncbi:MAG: GNAT family N-acetyltransferase [Nitrospira sp.]|nr:GNAT family N-acetyltransferase [Nitrospira sp.]